MFTFIQFRNLGRKLVAAIIIFTLIPFISSTALALETEYSPLDEVTSIPTNYQDLYISDNHLVWIKFDEGTQVFYRNLESGEERKLTSTKHGKKEPIVSADEEGNVYVAWLDYRLGGLSLWGMEINDKTEKQLSSTNSIDHRRSMDGANIVYSDQLENKVYYYSFVNGEEMEFGEGSNPITAKGKALYHKDDGLALIDLSSGESNQVVALPYNNYVNGISLAFNGTYSLHIQTDTERRTKYVLGDFTNPQSPEFTDITSNVDRETDYSQMHMGDHYVAWVQDNNGEPELIGMILETKKQFTIASGVGIFQTLFFVGDQLAMKGEEGKVIYRTFFEKDLVNSSDQPEITTEEETIEPIIDEEVVINEEMLVTADAKPTASKVLVNTEEVAFQAYNINDNNYFKLRDLAMILNGTDKNFAVGWDEEKNAISLESGKKYSAVGGELVVAEEPAAEEAKLSTSTIYLDGKEVKLTAYNINNNNYFKLRDVAAVIDFGVTWDGETNTVGIDSTTGYIAE